MSWVRLWHDMPSDPKWRSISRKCGERVADVVAVYTMMLVVASQSEDRGSIVSWSDEDAAACLDMDEEAVARIRSAMVGKVIDNDRLSGWEKRQPKREDGAAERAKRWRETQKSEANACERSRTHANAQERPDTDTDTEITTPEEARERDEVRVPPADGMWTKAHYDHLEAACLEAIGPAANQTTAGLKNLAPVHAWLNSGADLYADIIPTLRGRASSMQPGTVRSWVFFTDAVLEAKTRRLAPAPVFLPSRPPAQNRDPYRKRLTDEEILAAASNNRVAK